MSNPTACAPSHRMPLDRSERIICHRARSFTSKHWRALAQVSGTIKVVGTEKLTGVSHIRYRGLWNSIETKRMHSGCYILEEVGRHIEARDFPAILMIR